MTEKAEKTVTKRSMWSGSVSIGLINVPAKLVSMHKSDSPFKMLHRGDLAPIEEQKVYGKNKTPIQSQDEIVKGFKLDDGTYAVFDKAELDALRPKNEKLIKIEGFVPEATIDHVYYDKNYVMVPDHPRHSYFLLQSALEATGKVGIGKVVIRSKEHVAVVRSYDGGIVLSTLHYASEMTKPSAISALHERDKVPKEELELATTLVNTLATPVDISSFRNKQREEILKIVDLKKQGKSISPTVIQEVAPTESDAMLESLRKSIEIVKKQ